ncbi:MAG TPA: NADH-quinone oxidoreductase subunit NuoH [Candidatus Bathyarchaeia archaeon]|nr:NADH-quinone oxidoreductase subunit NuoH [Candidatus Bathyarchaeia archaeon]
MGIIETIWQILTSPPVFIPLIFPGFITLMIVLLLLIWFERKLTAKVQMRYGPLYIFKAFGGAIQMVADLLKYLFSEFIVPKDADKKVFILAPIMFFTFTLLPLVAIPISSTFTAMQSDLTMLLVPAIGTLAPLMVILIGWSSNNKYSFIGSLREGYIMMTYEIPMFISILAMALTYNSLNLIQIVDKQSGFLWGIVLNPLAAITFFGTLLMTTARFPFDISEAESEIVVGPYTEYSGIVFVLCLGAPYVKLYVLSLFYSLVFLGGWNPLFWPLNTNPILPGLAVLVKGAIIMALAVFMRTIYPRYRLDQALRLGWHKLFALSILSVILALVLVGLGVL